MTSDPTAPEPTTHPGEPPPSVGRFVAIALSISGLALVALIAIVVVFGGPSMGSTGDGQVCVEAYTPDTLANRMFAFDGTVTGVEGEDVTFRVQHPYIGVDADTLTLGAPGLTTAPAAPAASADGTTPPAETLLVVGQRYLVSGDDGVAWGCGFTRPHDPATAETWSSVFALAPAPATPTAPPSG